ncbi:MAG: DUF2237 family protein [Flavobacteriaceae bacterium]
MKEQSLNVYGEALEICGCHPLTGAFRNGWCDTGTFDAGTHTVCAEVTEEFLAFSKAKGNDLSRAYPEYNFTGLVPGNRWCLCISRWLEAYRADVAPPIVLEACHLKTLEYISLEKLIPFALR